MSNEKIKISRNFKLKAILSIFLITLFVFVYISLLGLAFWLTATCFYWGLFIINSYISIQTILLGLGIIGFDS
jgi:hypothetical protein